MEHAVASVEKPISKPFLRTWDEEMERLAQSSRWATSQEDDTILPEGNVFHFMNGPRLVEEHELWSKEGVFPDLSSLEEPVIIDCGSDTGYTVIRMAQTWPKAQIYGFEANPIKTKMLYRNLDAMGLRNVSLVSKATFPVSIHTAFPPTETFRSPMASRLR